MNKSDQWVIIILVLFILLHLSVLIIVLLCHKLPCLVSLLNLVAGLSIMLYWVQKEIRIIQHTTELREILVLGFEVAVIIISFYSFISNQRNIFLNFTRYLFFGIHFLCLILFLVFMLTFKMNRLI
jgi:hypothetical protein